MKEIKIILVFTLAIIAGIAYGQDTNLVNKKGIPILPNSGDWAFGIDARPFTQIFNDYSSVSFDFINNYTFMGKKFINPKLAHRVKIRIGYYSDIDDRYIIQDGQTIPEPAITVKDSRTVNMTNLAIGYGLEKRRGYGRLQAVYGAEIMLQYQSTSQSFKYGNDFSMTNPDPSTTNFGNNIPDYGKRITYIEDGNSFGGSLHAFIGVEYFFAAKMSIGGEFGWGLSYTNQTEGNEKVQSWDAGNNNIKNEFYKTGGQKYFGIDNTNNYGAIFLIFYFN